MTPIQQALPLEHVIEPTDYQKRRPGYGAPRNMRDTLGCPCDACEFAAKCDREHLACADYVRWIATGAPPIGDRVPTRAQYRKAYHISDD